MRQEEAQNNLAIRIVTVNKVKLNPQEVALTQKLDLVWIYHPQSDLKNFEAAMKTQFREQVNLIKSRRLDALKQYHTNTEQCLVLLDHSYEKEFLSMFKNDKVHYLIYTQDLTERARDYTRPQVLFMASKQEALIEYMRNYLQKVRITGANPPLASSNGDSLKHIAQKLQDFLASKRSKQRGHLPKIGKSPVRVEKQTNPDFLNSNVKNPGPGAYSPERNIKGKSTTFGRS